jgi:hypothetical protein
MDCEVTLMLDSSATDLYRRYRHYAEPLLIAVLSMSERTRNQREHEDVQASCHRVCT